MSDTIQSAEKFVDNLRGYPYSSCDPTTQRMRDIEKAKSRDAAHIALGREMERTARADEARNCPRKTIQSAATNNIGGFLDSLVDLISEDAGQDEWIKAGELLEARDAAIRADEARKQAERYAACVDLAWKALKAINGMRFPENHPALVLFPELNKALADLEAPK
jgi:hypothetical protein